MAIRDYGADRTRRLKVRIGAKLGAPGDGEVVIEQRARSQAEFLPASDVGWTKYRKVAARQAKRIVAALNHSRHWMTRLFEHRIRPPKISERGMSVPGKATADRVAAPDERPSPECGAETGAESVARKVSLNARMG